MDERQANSGSHARRHETTDADVRAIGKFVVGLFLALVATLVVARLVFNYFAAHQGLGPPASPFANQRELPPPGVPRLQAAPPLELDQYREQQEKLLQSYGWVDQSTGIVRIPIDRAMDLLIQRGLPVQAHPPQGELRRGTVPQYMVPKGYTPEH
jgi:hypothetical protein